MKIRYTPQAGRDLRLIKEYISTQLMNYKAAKVTVKEILDTCMLLEKNPFLGYSLAAKINLETDYRCLVCKKHIIFYKLEPPFISIIRVLDQRTDYLDTLGIH